MVIKFGTLFYNLLFLGSVVVLPLRASTVLATSDIFMRADNARYSVGVRRLTIEEQRLHHRSDFLLLLKDWTASAEHILPIEDGVDTISSLIIRDTTVVALGSLWSSRGDVFIFVDLTSAKFQRSVRCYWPVLSPDSTLAAFENWYPRMGPPESRRLGISVLDLTTADSLVKQVYPPPGGVGLEAENVALEGRSVHQTISPITWSPDGRVICFVDLFSPWGTWAGASDPVLIAVDLHEWPDTIRHVSAAIAPLVYAKSGTPRESLRFRVETIRWIDDDTVELSLFPQDYWAVAKVRIDVPGILQHEGPPRRHGDGERHR